MEKYWNRVIAFDLETNVVDQNFLTNERILAVGVARREWGGLLSREVIITDILFLDLDNDAEFNLLLEFGKILAKIRPLGVIGYGMRQYDIPLLAIKKQYYGDRMKKYKEFWKLIDFLESAIRIDLYHILKYLGIRKFNEIFNSDIFSKIPVVKSKNLVTISRYRKVKRFSSFGMKIDDLSKNM